MAAFECHVRGTPVAKAFRRCVLDVIEQYGDRVHVAKHTALPILQCTYALPVEPYEKASKEQRRPIDHARKAWVAVTVANGRMLIAA